MKIALVGYSRSGKDTVAQMIQDEIKSCIPLAFGDSMKTLFHDLFPDIPEEPKPRDLYENFAQSMREFDEDVWVRKVEKKMSGYRKNFNFIITDVRQPNEARWARENGFTLVEVWSPLGFRIQRSEFDSEFAAVTKSEEFLHDIKCDYTIKNHGSLEELKERVNGLITVLKMIEVGKRETAPDRRNEKGNQHHGKQRRNKKK